ncbi:MAG: hypothetical protein HGA78_11810 [Nitrospirales bacterium]|nr:hypothetical protein [Nitrospirales bacterium]
MLDFFDFVSAETMPQIERMSAKITAILNSLMETSKDKIWISLPDDRDYFTSADSGLVMDITQIYG